MKVQHISDPHFEFHRDNGRAFVNALDPTAVDVLVLSGDVLSLKHFDQFDQVFRTLCSRYPSVVYVPGNHEYYGITPTEGAVLLDHLNQSIENLSVLVNSDVTISDQRFVGGTMWFQDRPDNVLYQSMMRDFSVIRSFVPWVHEENRRCLDYFARTIQASDIVITHHLPAKQSVAEQYEGNALNRFFLCDVESLIVDRQPKLWLHGHTHTPLDYRLGDTRIVANVFGYPGETKRWYREKCVIDIDRLGDWAHDGWTL